MNLYLTNPGKLLRKDNTLIFEIFKMVDGLQKPEEETPLDEDRAVINKHALPIESIDAIYVFNETRINTKLLNFLSQKNIPVFFFNYYGFYSGAFLPTAEQLSGNLVIEQGAAFSDNERRIHICKAITESKIHNSLSILKHHARHGSDLTEQIQKIEQLQRQVLSAEKPDEIMGFEGLAGRSYYACWKHSLGDSAPGFKRVYNPPDTPVNALISFLNSMLYTACVSEIYRTALYPGISYIHAPQSRRFSLALDICEPFKPVMVDRLLFRLLDNNIISDSYFRKDSNGTMLTDEARKKVIKEWDEQLRTTVKSKTLKRSISYRQLIRLDCYKLIKFLIEGKPFKPYRMTY